MDFTMEECVFFKLYISLLSYFGARKYHHIGNIILLLGKNLHYILLRFGK